MENREAYIKYLTQYLDEKRFRHSLGVEQTARELAERFGEDAGQAALAGLLHDCAKSRKYTPEQMRAFAARSRFQLSQEDIRLSPHLLHAPAGETVARETLGIADDAVLGAICWHTVPSDHMSKLEKIVSLADMIEPNREFPGVKAIRQAAQRDLDEAFLLSMKRTILHLLEHNMVVHPYTLTAYNQGAVNAPRVPQPAAKRRKIAGNPRHKAHQKKER
ncbi:MAG: bis(5'-nucleosyl)-tetraphosphatase (symmetrical) YqeK [Eubacteriales bacterium]|nr:bis(5'-nucleosyl)-tetraphosphatase (symmetrical) YqeK [Eubacteriales bacterium]